MQLQLEYQARHRGMHKSQGPHRRTHTGSLARFVQRGHTHREGSRDFGPRGGRGRACSRGRGRGRFGPEEERIREPRTEDREARQDPNMVTGSVNIIEI